MSCQGCLFVILLTIFIKNGKMTDLSNRIFGGEFVQKGDLPYMALVKQLVRGDICGGAIISEKHILTGGMCAKYHARPFDRSIVVTGTVTVTQGGETHRIEHAIAHPLFHKHYPEVIRFDVGVITLCVPIKFNKYQQPVKLPSQPVQDGDEAVVAGWGHTKTTKTPEILQKLVTKVYSAKACAQMQGAKSYTEGSRICTVNEKGKGFCNYDNGGPLVVKGVVVGIASLLYGCGIGKKDQYADVYACLNFILDEIRIGCLVPGTQSDTITTSTIATFTDVKCTCNNCLDRCWSSKNVKDYNYIF